MKPQAAFFEELGPAGMAALAGIVRYAREQGLLVILDGKRNDIGSTATAYARGFLGRESPWGADALTVSPYLGDDSLQPFVEVAAEQMAGLFVLVKTSNPGGRMIQDLRRRRQADLSARGRVRRTPGRRRPRATMNTGPWGPWSAPPIRPQLAELRAVMPHAWFLVPGFGSQGGTAADVAAAFDPQGRGAIVNNSRGIIFAHSLKPYNDRFGPARWQEAVEAATDDMIAQLRAETPAGKLVNVISSRPSARSQGGGSARRFADFFRAEEDVHFPLGGLGAVGSVDEIHLPAGAVVAADRAGGRIPAVGRANHLADHADRLRSFGDQGHIGTRRDECLQAGYQSLRHVFGVMPSGQFGRHAHHLHGDDVQAFFLKTGDNPASQPALDTVGLQQDERSFHG